MKPGIIAHPQLQTGRILGVVAVFAFGSAIFLLMLAAFGTGPLGTDDSLYWDASGGWRAHVPFVGTSHWALRHTLVIPLALARCLFGDGPTALLVPTVTAALGLIAVLLLWVSRVAGVRSAWVVAALIATNPSFVLFSSTAWIDVVEMFFVFAAFALLQRSVDRGPSWSVLLLAGVFAGLGVMSRETAVFAVAALGLLFLFGFGLERRWYFVLGLGFLAVVGSEIAFYWAMTGDPFYRITISLHHDSTINRWVEQGAAVPLAHPLIDPVTMLLLNHYFGLVFWIGLPLAVWMASRPRQPGPMRNLFILVGTLSLTWGLLAAALWHGLPLAPRYYALPVAGVSVLAGIALVHLYDGGRTRLAIALGGLLLLGNVAAIAGDNRNFMYGERMLADLATRQTAVIHTDPQTFRRAGLMLEWRGVAARVVTTPPGPGDLFFYNPTRVAVGFRPGPGWQVVEQRIPAETLPETWMLTLARSLPIAVPSRVLEKLGPGHPGVTLYRTD